MMRRLKTLPLSRPRGTDSGYVGTKTVYEPVGELTASVQPIRDVTEAKLYGVSISAGLLLFCENGADIRERDRVEWKGRVFEIKSVLPYEDHIRLEAEKV